MNLWNRYIFKVILFYLHYHLQYYNAYSQQVIFNHGIGENEFIVSSVKLSYNQCLTRFNSYTGHANTMVYKRRFSVCYMHFVCGTFEHVQEPGSVLAHRSMIEAKDCLELYEMGWREDGTYTIKPDGSTCIRTWCDMTNGGWTVIQRRMNGRENFYRTWEEYVHGFGHALRQ
ncbi:fibroleukin-like [Ruditapes philippinarum]|uniref:fibroleukin-like n=1 Tax=Ruditapes philippinarum TaxID=129788 RepID=UPI00295B022F|nr:fibroleukin-like [Ruditapes philippinarum]